jgi:hypothetical protein
MPVAMHGEIQHKKLGVLTTASDIVRKEGFGYDAVVCAIV